jgi:hypothetical protein
LTALNEQANLHPLLQHPVSISSKRKEASAVIKKSVVVTFTSTPEKKPMTNRVWIVSYIPAELARAPLVVQERHRRVRCFTDAYASARFVLDPWASGDWRVISEAEVELGDGNFAKTRSF